MCNHQADTKPCVIAISSAGYGRKRDANSFGSRTWGSIQSASFSLGIIAGIRSWIGLMISFACVVMIVHVLIVLPPGEVQAS